MSKEAMTLALEALENSVDLVREDAYQAEKLYGNYPTRQGKVNGLKVLADDHEKAITALRKALANEALGKMAENAGELGLDYEPAQPYKSLADYPRYWIDPVTGDVGIGTPSPQPAQPEPVAGQPLPCPFCGHIGLDFADGETFRWGVASCGGCGASCGDVRREYPDKGEWHTEAIAEWNRRSPAAQRPWQGLTDEEIEQGCKESWVTEQAWQSAVWWAEAKLKEKNT